MIILSIDTAFDACSAATLSGDDILWTEQQIIGKGHAEALPPMIARGLRAARIAPRDIDRIGVVIGPGAFAGVRVGLAFARAFRIGLKADVVGLTSNEALAASLAPGRGLIASVFDARRGQVYAALHDAMLAELLAPFVASPAGAAEAIMAAANGAPLRLAGSGAFLLAPHTGGRSMLWRISIRSRSRDTPPPNLVRSVRLRRFICARRMPRRPPPRYLPGSICHERVALPPGHEG